MRLGQEPTCRRRMAARNGKTLVATTQFEPDETGHDLIPITVVTLRPLERLSFDLYHCADGAAPVLYREQSYPLTQEDIDRLIERQVLTLYASATGHRKYIHYLRENVQELISDERVAPDVRFQVWQECARAQVDEAYHSLNLDRTMALFSDTGQQVAELVGNSEIVPHQLFSVAKHDFYTFTHMVNVSSYCVALAKLMGVDDERQLERIAVGGLLHDIGKRAIPAQILNKPGPLTLAERHMVQSHPTVGYELLCEREDLQFDQLMMVYQHHEALDGTGYPVGVTADDIHWTSRLCAVVDVFDAMSCDRPYRKRMPLSEVTNRLESIAGSQLDADLVTCWVDAVRSGRAQSADSLEPV